MLVRAPASDDDDNQPVAVGRTMRRLGELVRRMLGCERVSIVGLESGADRMQPLALLGAPPAEERQWSDAVLRSRLSRSLSPDQMAQLISGETAVIDAPQPIEGGPQPLGAARGLVAPMLVADQLLGLLTVDFGAAHDDYTAEERTLAGATARLGALVIERERLVRDREAAQEAELAQREVIRRMDEFLATASHDLRSPLAGIHLRVQLATRRARQLVHDLAHLRHELVPLGTRMLVDLEDADVAAGRIERLVKRLLDVARARTGTLDMRPELIDLARVVREVVEEQRFAAAARAIAMQLTGTSPMTVVADADRIAQVVTNYLTNAIRYSPAGAPITVALGAESAAARVEVRDEGPGIPPDEQERIWARFARANSVKQARDHDTETGLGMGLYISREIVERHGGAVGVESAPGHGSTFWFTLPLATAD
jgi:signal transduction histidine kinase